MKIDDPALTEPIANIFARNDAKPMPKAQSPRRETPQARLKKATRGALKDLSE